jgi:hypothetical protein
MWSLYIFRMWLTAEELVSEVLMQGDSRLYEFILIRHLFREENRDRRMAGPPRRSHEPTADVTAERCEVRSG